MFCRRTITVGHVGERKFNFSKEKSFFVEFHLPKIFLFMQITLKISCSKEYFCRFEIIMKDVVKFRDKERGWGLIEVVLVDRERSI